MTPTPTNCTVEVAEYPYVNSASGVPRAISSFLGKLVKNSSFSTELEACVDLRVCMHFNLNLICRHFNDDPAELPMNMMLPDLYAEAFELEDKKDKAPLSLWMCASHHVFSSRTYLLPVFLFF